jgi:hypothetical protein
MTTDNRFNKTGRRLVGLVLVLIVLVMFFAFGPRHFPGEADLERAKALGQLPNSRALWSAQQISDYTVDLDMSLTACIYFKTVRLEVRRNQLYRIIVLNQDGSPSVSETHVGIVSPTDYETCDVGQRTITDMFVTVEQELATLNTASTFVKVRFNPTYGFVEEYRIEPNGSSSTCCSTYNFSNFQVISNTVTTP